jgi:Peptidase family M28
LRAVSELIDSMRAVVEPLAKLNRPPCSPGEKAAAEWIAERLTAAGARGVRTEAEPAWGPFPPTLTGVALASLLGTILTLRGRRLKGALLSAGALAGLADEIQNGPRVLRRAVRRQKTTTNVVAEVGDADADRTLVVLAHHDAAQTGFVFDQSWAKFLHARYPQLLAKPKNQPPQWWLGVAPTLLTLKAAVSPRKKGARLALLLGALATVTIADIARSPTVPGANDNLSAVAALVALAESTKERELEGIRILLVSCGAEESFQEGIRAYMARHGKDLPTEKTWFLNLDTIGSPHLVMLEGEGPIWMEDYCDPSFRDLVAASARSAGVELQRGTRARASTDAIIPSRAGYPTSNLVSAMPWRLPGNYHLMTDVPENLDYESIEDSVTIALEVAGALGRSDRRSNY